MSTILRTGLPILLLLLATNVVARQADPPPFKVAPYLQFGIDTMMAVLWETDVPATTRVEFGESRYGDTAPNLEQTIEVPGLRTMHEVVLAGLKPATKYFWRAVSMTNTDDVLQSEPSTFRTAVGDSSAFAFVMYSDTQDNPETWGRLAELGWLERPNFGVVTGDLVGSGGRLEDWLVDFFPPANVFMKRFPLFTVIGNHEDDHPLYYQYMHNPPPEYRYTFRYGNAQFFMVDTNRDIAEGSEQWNWLERELAASEATWKFVLHHHPPYSSEENDHGNSWTGSTTYGTHARDLVPLYERYGVDFCLFGHVHMYERTWPIFEGQVNQKNGVIYINAGGGGGGLEQFAPTRSWFSAKVKSVHHYTYFAIHGDRLFYQAIDEQGRLFDQFEITKWRDAELNRKAAITLPPAPRIEPFGGLFDGTVEVMLEAALEDMAVHFTLDGSAPGSSSPRYEGPLRLETTTTLRAVAVSSVGAVGREERVVFRRAEPAEPLRSAGSTPGFTYAYFEGDFRALPEFAELKPAAEGVTAYLDPTGLKQRQDGFGFVFEGILDVPDTGIYTFETFSDDASRLWVGDELVVDNDSEPGSVHVQGQVALKRGPHRVRITYFDDHGGEDLSVSWWGPGVHKQHLRGESVTH